MRSDLVGRKPLACEKDEMDGETHGFRVMRDEEVSRKFRPGRGGRAVANSTHEST